MATLSSQAAAAKLIKIELKKIFPLVKFSVTSEHYSGGESVSIHWDGPPTKTEMRSLVSKYELGKFNGITDIYEYSNKNDTMPQVHYIHLYDR